MHRYKQIEYKTKRVIEVIRCIPVGCRAGAGGERGPKREPKTAEEIREANRKQAARKLARKINLNFEPGDYHLVLTYKRTLTPDKQEAGKEIKSFLIQMRKAYKRAGQPLKYISVTEYKGKRIHHHLIINSITFPDGTTAGLVRSLWKDNGSVLFSPLYDSGEYGALAEYLIKETDKTFRETDSPAKQRYSCSRNLKNPKPEIHYRTVRKGWKELPDPRRGYYIKPDSLYNGYDKMGYRYQRYILIRLNADGKEWDEPGDGWVYDDYWPE